MDTEKISKHTPGPWEFEDETIFTRRKKRLVARTGGVVYTEDTPTHQEHVAQAIANARLIAAAPEMLEALEAGFEALKRNLEDLGDCDHNVGICYCGDWDRLDKMKAAIAKAKGKV